jgi:tripeptide aminopeptidase
MELIPPKETVLERFKRYVQIDTQSAEDSESFPSTEKQLVLCRLLVDELKAMGVDDAAMDEHGYVFGTISSNLPKQQADKVPAIGFLAHVDTSPAAPGDGVKPLVHANYQGGDITLPGDASQIIRVEEYPNLKEKYIGMDIITSDGTTLLGADDKAGIAEIMTAADMLLQNLDIPHGTVKIGFTPDEEVGQGTKYFDVKKFNADFAYTIDGGPLGELEYETFNAFSATFDIKGIGVHPGYAKDKMVNALRVVADIIEQLPKDMAPETTEDREGYLHPYLINGQTENVTLKVLLRDFEMDNIEKQKKMLEKTRDEVQGLYPKAKIELKIEESYRNMRYKIEEEPRLLEYAQEAIRRAGVEPTPNIIRGGTDGAVLSYKGLLTPNLFAGGEAIHSKMEWVPVQVMKKSVETILNLISIWKEKSV